MINLSENTLSLYRKRVQDIYSILEREPWCSLGYFEHCMRQISVLNSKIRSVRKSIKTSEIQKE